MKRYRVSLFNDSNGKSIIVYTSADCVACAYWKVCNFLDKAYGTKTYFLLSITGE